MLTWLAATLMAAAPLLAATCAEATVAPLGHDLRAYELAAGDFAFFDVEVPTAGWLLAEASAPVGSEAGVRLALFGADCGPAAPDDVRIVARWISGLIVEVEAPGVHRLAVAAEDPGAPLAEVALTTRFVDASVACRSVPEKTHADPEPDPDTLFLCLEKTHADPEPDPDTLLAGRGSLCPRTGDDHDHVFACATAVVPGKPVNGSLSWDDVDVFTFTVVAQRTVEITTQGDATIHGALYDNSGHRLAVDDAGEGLRLAGTLAPGRYHVRTGGIGDYTLTVEMGSW